MLNVKESFYSPLGPGGWLYLRPGAKNTNYTVSDIASPESADNNQAFKHTPLNFHLGLIRYDRVTHRATTRGETNFPEHLMFARSNESIHVVKPLQKK